ncbi:MAG: lysozyme inhibitor LprI family protein [Myxococcales bacterium]
MPAPSQLRIAGLALLALAWPEATWAFDCVKATAPDEKALCQSESLTTLDDLLNDVYQAARARSEDAAAPQADQRSWLKERRACAANAPCLKARMEERIVSLSALLGCASKPRQVGPLKVQQIWRRSTCRDHVFDAPRSAAAAVTAINAFLDDPPPKADEGCSEDDERWLVYATGQIATVEQRGMSYCGGPYPNAFHSFHTWNLQTGAELSVADLFGPKTTFETAIAALKAAGAGKLEDYECDYLSKDSPCADRQSAQVTVSIHQQGVATLGVVCSWIHAIQACGGPWDLPAQSLKGRLTPAGRRLLGSLTGSAHPHRARPTARPSVSGMVVPFAVTRSQRDQRLRSSQSTGATLDSSICSSRSCRARALSESSWLMVASGGRRVSTGRGLERPA